MMDIVLLRYVHVLGAVLMSAGLIGVWVADLRSRQTGSTLIYAECARFVAVFYDGLVLPGAVVLLISGGWMIAMFYGAGFLDQPWLMGMVGLFVFEFVEGNTLTRVHFTRLRRLSRRAAADGTHIAELQKTRRRFLPTLAHFLDLPMIALILALGVVRPQTWDMLAAGLVVAFAIAGALTVWIPRLYPWVDEPPAP